MRVREASSGTGTSHAHDLPADPGEYNDNDSDRATESYSIRGSENDTENPINSNSNSFNVKRMGLRPSLEDVGDMSMKDVNNVDDRDTGIRESEVS